MFHAKEGWYFGRQEGGSVRILTPDPEVTILLDPDTWCSVIASVSAKGETAETFAEAEKFHVGEK